jgi:chorismate-pyruvate lyase
VLAGRGIGPFAGGAGTGIGAAQPYIEAAAGGVHDVAGDPVMAATAPLGEIMMAHRLGVAREAARQIASLADHDASSGQAAARARAPRRG